MRGYPLSLEKGAELCTAINISILHKFENTKHKRFGSVGRYMNKRNSCEGKFKYEHSARIAAIDKGEIRVRTL